MKKLFCILFSFLVLKANAQQLHTTLPSLRGIYRASYINPAFAPEYKLTVGLPVINNLGLRFNLTGIDLHTIASNIDDGFLNMNTLYDDIDGAIGFNIPVNFDLFFIRFPVKGWYVSINNSVKANQNVFNVSKEFIGFLSQGNNYFIGKTQNYDLFNINLNVYNETGIGISKEFRRLSIGARFKVLSGIANLQTERIRMNLNTSSVIPFPMTLTMSGNIRTGGLPLVVTQDSIDGKPVTDDDKELKNVVRKLPEFPNSGYGFDIGIGYQFNTNFSAYISVIDIGSSINWKSNTYNYKIDDSKVEFNGLTLDEVNNKDNARDILIDSMTSKLGKAYVTRDSYVTPIPTKYYLGLDYDFTTKDRVGFLFQGQSVGGTFYSAYTGSYMRRLGRNWQITGNYSVKTFGGNDFGAGTSSRLGPVQFFFFCDNLMTFIKPTRARNLYFSFGINLVFGRNPKVFKMY